MEQLISIVGILAVLLLGAMSPGPSFLVVTRTALSGARRAGIATAVGLGAGSAVFGALALGGLHLVFEQVGWLYLVLKVAGGSYLLYLAVRIFSGAKTPLEVSEDRVRSPEKAGLLKALVLGFVTQLSNPKTAVVFASVFATFLVKEPEIWLYATLVSLIFVLETAWYCLVALVFSSARPRALYGGAKTWIDRTVSGILGAMGVRLIGDAL